MAHTSNGKLRGQAARTDRADQANWLLDEQLRVDRQEQQRKQQLIDQLMQQCYDIEGDSFIAWWEDDNNVPPIITRSEQIRVLEGRLRLHIATGIAATATPCPRCLGYHITEQCE